MWETWIRNRNGWRRLVVALCCAVTLGAGTGACRKNDEAAGTAASGPANPIRRSDRFQAVAGNDRRFVAVGAYGVVAVSSDQGKTWVRHELSTAPALIGIAVCGDGGFAALDFAGTLWRSDKDAEKWQSAKIPAADSLLGITCTPDNRIWVVGARGALLSSADSGRNWRDQSLDEDIQLLNIQFSTPSFGVVTGEFGRTLISRDGGASWDQAGSLGETFYPYAMHFLDADRGVVGGLAGVVQETRDGGHSWRTLQSPSPAPFYGVLMRPDGQVIAVGAGGAAFRLAAGVWEALPGDVPKADLRGLALTRNAVLIAGTATLAALPLAETPAAN